MPTTITYVIPDNVPIKRLSGTTDGQNFITFMVDDSSNRLIFTANASIGQYTEVTSTPVTYETWHTKKIMNIRTKPNTLNSSYSSQVTANTNLNLSTQLVTPQLLAQLGLDPMAYPINNDHEWRHIGSGTHKGKFIATRSKTNGVWVDNCARGAYVPPTQPPTQPPPTGGKPTALTGKQFSLVARNGGIYLNNGTGMGANLREIAYWGHQGVNTAKWMSPNDIDRYLVFLRDNGFRWVRFTAIHNVLWQDNKFNLTELSNRVRAIADKLAAHNLLGCVTFYDSLDGAGFNLPPYASYHNQVLGHLNKSFYVNKAYNTHLRAAIERVVGDLRGNPGVGMWQPFNEAGAYPQPASEGESAAIATCFKELSSLIHLIDPGTPISSGAISTNHFAPTGADRRTYARNFWRSQPNLHVATVHAYQDTTNPSGLFADESYMHIDAEEALASGRAFGMTEFGSNNNRVSVENSLLQRIIGQKKASMAFRWALDLEMQDRGIGDKDWGWMRWQFTDFDQLLSLFKGFRW